MHSERDYFKDSPDREPSTATGSTPAPLTNPNPRWQALALQPLIVQPQLNAGDETDSHERAAESVAAEVTRDNETQAATADTRTGRTVAHPPTGGAPEGRAASPVVHAALNSSGEPLDNTTRAYMESRLGADFSGVRVHTGPEAARANETLQSRAFTTGQRIAFASGQYSPGTPVGRGLIAHELTHVQQQSHASSAGLIQRAPALDGRKTTELIDESIAGDIDKALAESATIGKYINAKALKKISGRVSVDDPEVFKSRYQKYAKDKGDMPDVKDVPGYFDRKQNMIELKSRNANIEAIIHEAIHFNSRERFANLFGHALNEGITEYFTEAVLREQKLGTGSAYRAELKLATAFVASVGEQEAANAYFTGDHSALKAVTDALNKAKTYSKWRTAILSKVPADWETAARLLTAAMGR